MLKITLVSIHITPFLKVPIWVVNYHLPVVAKYCGTVEED